MEPTGAQPQASRQPAMHPSTRVTGAQPDFGTSSSAHRSVLFLGLDKNVAFEAPEPQATAVQEPLQQHGLPKTINDNSRVLVGIGAKAKYRRACAHPGCTKRARPGNRKRDWGYCVAHGGGVVCAEEQCSAAAISGYSYCIKHGGGRRCTIIKNHRDTDMLPHARYVLPGDPEEKPFSGKWIPRPEYAGARCCYSCFTTFRQIDR